MLNVKFALAGNSDKGVNYLSKRKHWQRSDKKYLVVGRKDATARAYYLVPSPLSEFPAKQYINKKPVSSGISDKRLLE